MTADSHDKNEKQIIFFSVTVLFPLTALTAVYK